MSKSYNNQVDLAATEKETSDRIASAVTDPARQYRKDPGHPEVCNVYSLHKFFAAGSADSLAMECRNAAIGCVECKRTLAREINEVMRPFRNRREKLVEQPGLVEDVIRDGAIKARVLARDTIGEVKEKLGLWCPR